MFATRDAVSGGSSMGAEVVKEAAILTKWICLGKVNGELVWWRKAE
jgi:hypothetical protein